MLAAGDLDRRIRIEQATETQAPDGSGEPETTWATVAEVWAQKDPLGGRELFTAQQVAAKVDTRFRLRWRNDVRPERMRIVDEDLRLYDIQAVQEIGRRDGLLLLTSARGEEP